MLKSLCLLIFALISVIHCTPPPLKTGKPHSSVQILGKTNLHQAIQDPANGLWLLKFYAPWCGHCKRLAPVLAHAAAETEGLMAIGKIDCDQERELCKEFGIKGFPTLMFSRDGDIQEFPFSRSKEDIKKFAVMMNAPAVRLCDSYDDALELAAATENGIVFVGYHPHVKGETRDEKLQSTHLTQVLNQSGRIHQAFSTFCLLSPTADVSKFGFKEAPPPNGFVAKLEAGGVPPVILNGRDDLSSNELLDFVKEKNIPLVAQLGPHNFNKVSRNGKPIVIGAVNGSDEAQVKTMKQRLLNYALSGPKELVDKYYFGYIDGKQWNKFLTQFNITSDELPQVFVLDAPAKVYWHDASYDSIAAFMEAVDNGTVEKRGAGSASGGFVSGILSTFADAFHAFFPWSLAVLVAFLVLFVLLLLPAPQELRPPYPQQEASTAQAPKSDTATTTDAPAVEEETKKDK